MIASNPGVAVSAEDGRFIRTTHPIVVPRARRRTQRLAETDQSVLRAWLEAHRGAHRLGVPGRWRGQRTGHGPGLEARWFVQVDTMIAQRLGKRETAMIEATRTTTALLEGLHDPTNEAVWMEFDRRYRPILLGFGRKLGLGDADAADIAQETLTQFITEYRTGRYDRDRGRLRSWLISIAKYRVLQMRRKQAGRREARGESAVVQMPDEHQLTAIWDTERRTVLLQQALRQLRAHTKTSDRAIETFDLFVMKQMPAEEVARRLNIKRQEVYLAKSRVSERLRDILSDLEATWDDTP